MAYSGSMLLSHLATASEVTTEGGIEMRLLLLLLLLLGLCTYANYRHSFHGSSSKEAHIHHRNAGDGVFISHSKAVSR